MKMEEAFRTIPGGKSIDRNSKKRYTVTMRGIIKPKLGVVCAMGYRTVSFEKRIKENIRNYAIKNLYPMDLLSEYFHTIAKNFGMEILLTDRHGEHAVWAGDFTGFQPDVVNEPGEKLRICDRTIGHVYAGFNKAVPEKRDEAMHMLRMTIKLLEELGTEVYMHRESASYMEELEARVEKERCQIKYGEKEDILTGVLNKNYFESRMNVLDRAETVPTAVINININDWKFVYDNFGIDESDSLIQLVASILMKEAKPEYIIGRIDGDVFAVLIPMPIEDEAEDYCRRVQAACMNYDEGSVLAPSVAVGIVYKTNVEEALRDKISDAEYEMFNNKIEIKNAPGYQERLRRGLKQK